MKKNTVLIVIIVILSILVVGLGGYIVYDRIITEKEGASEKKDNEEVDEKKLVDELSKYIPSILYNFEEGVTKKTVFDFTDSVITKVALKRADVVKKEVVIPSVNGITELYVNGMSESPVRPGDKVTLEVNSKADVLKQIEKMFGKDVADKVKLPEFIPFEDCLDLSLFVLSGDYYVMAQAQMGMSAISEKEIVDYKVTDNNVVITYNNVTYYLGEETPGKFQTKETFEKDSSGKYIWKSIELINN